MGACAHGGFSKQWLAFWLFEIEVSRPRGSMRSCRTSSCGAHLKTRMMNRHYPNCLDEIAQAPAKSRWRPKAPSISDLSSDSEGLR